MVEKDYYGFLDEVAEKLQAAQDPFSGQIRVKRKGCGKGQWDVISWNSGSRRSTRDGRDDQHG